MMGGTTTLWESAGQVSEINCAFFLWLWTVGGCSRGPVTELIRHGPGARAETALGASGHSGVTNKDGSPSFPDCVFCVLHSPFTHFSLKYLLSKCGFGDWIILVSRLGDENTIFSYITLPPRLLQKSKGAVPVASNSTPSNIPQDHLQHFRS